MNYSIDDFRKYNYAKNIIITLHSQLRLRERQISVDDVINAINTGDIIEEYPDDFPFPSCLILGATISGKFVHIVVSLDEGKIYLITAYYPTKDKWEDDLRTRKETKL